MKHLKKFNENELHDAAIRQYKEDTMRPGIPASELVGKRKLSEEFEKKAESYANLILYSKEYSALKDMAMAVDMTSSQGVNQPLKDFMDEFKKTFPSFVNPEAEGLATGMKLPFYGRTEGENPSSRFVFFSQYLVSKIQKPGYKL